MSRRKRAALTVDPNWLVDSFEYHEYTGEKDTFGKVKYADPVTVRNVRIDYSKVWKRNKTEAVVTANAVIFCVASHTTPFLDFKEQSKVEMDGKEYIIQKIIKNKEPYHDTLWSIELEVI